MPFPGLLPPGAVSLSPPLTNLVLWLKTPISGLNHNDTVTSWPDNSVSAKNFDNTVDTKPTYDTTNTVNGIAGVKFTAASHHSLTQGSPLDTSGYSAASMYMVMKRVNDPPLSGASNGDSGWCKTVSLATSSVFPYSDGNCYDNTFTSVRKDCGNPTPDLTNPFIYSCISQANSWVNRIAKSDFFSTVTNTYQGHAATLEFGRSSDTGGAQYWYDGWFYEILIYSTAHDSTTRDQVETYLSTRFAL